ncbi:MAG: HAMP domain-containing histidine kinase [Actinobacteria bacterium]|nr:HAMP domain-containing histidine kinase [Actinomycetota bacterium]
MRLRNRLFVGLGAIVVVFGIIVFLIANTQRRYLVEQVDRRLERSIGLAAGVVTDRPVPLPPEGAADLTELWVGWLALDGTLTPVVEGQLVTGSPDVTLDDARQHATRPGRGEPFTVDGFRVMAVARPDQQGWSIVALSLEAADAAYVRLLWALGLGALVVLTVVLLIGLWVLRLGVKPITEVTAAAEAIGAGERDRRVPSFPTGTEAAELSDAFNSMLDQKEAADERLRQFVADASHELRTPLTSIRGYADLYQRGGLAEPAKLDDAMRRVTGEAERMGALVDDLLLLSKLDRGLPIEHVSVDLASLLDDAAADARAVQPDRPIRVHCERPLLCQGDPLRLHQVVAALVHNALVHTPVDTAIELTGAPRDGAAVLEIIDHGPGLDPDVANKVFERFYRGDPSRARSSGGSGLGLSIAKSIVETHGGRITVHTAPGEGCRFTVAMPSSG